MITLAVVPAHHRLAWSLWKDTTCKLVGIELFDHPYSAAAWVSHRADVDRCLVEVPKAYGSTSGVDELLDLAVVAGASVGARKNVEQVQPRTWQGNAHPDTRRERALATMEDVTKRLINRYSKADKPLVLDAYGLGMWATVARTA